MSLELLSLGADFLGGLMGRSDQKKMHRDQLAMSQRQFDAQMDESVTRRVKDAKNAGVHPLFALGASVGASPTISSAGEPQGNPMQSALTSMARTLGVIEQNRASAKRDEAEAALLDSERARIEQELNNRRGTAKTYPMGEVRNDSILGEWEEIRPQIYRTQPGKPGTEAGRGPLFKELQDDQGRTVKIYSDSAQADEINQALIVWQRFGHKVEDLTNWLKKKGFLVKGDPGQGWIKITKEK